MNNILSNIGRKKLRVTVVWLISPKLFSSQAIYVMTVMKSTGLCFFVCLGNLMSCKSAVKTSESRFFMTAESHVTCGHRGQSLAPLWSALQRASKRPACRLRAPEGSGRCPALCAPFTGAQPTRVPRACDCPRAYINDRSPLRGISRRLRWSRTVNDEDGTATVRQHAGQRRSWHVFRSATQGKLSCHCNNSI